MLPSFFFMSRNLLWISCINYLGECLVKLIEHKIMTLCPPPEDIIPSEVRSLLGLESRFVWLLGVYSRASKFSYLLSSATQATLPCVTGSKAVASLKMVMQGLQTLWFGWIVLAG